MAAIDTVVVHPSLPSSIAARVSVETVERAVKALLKWRHTRSLSQKPQLLEQEDFIYLILTLKKIPPKSRTNAFRIPLPHSLHSGSELCLIIDDRSKSNLSSESAKKKIKSEDIPIAKVIKLSKLKSDYKPFEAKRKLCDSYDMFFVDKRVVPLLPRLLGKKFFVKKKIPVPVDLSHNNWKEQIERACGSAMVYFRTGTCSVIKVGKASMGSEEIVENVFKTIEGILGLVPKKWNGVRSLHLKFSESLALPIYQAVPDVLLKIDGRKKLDEDVEEESKEDEKLIGKNSEFEKKKKKKKGRIHEVKYMDGDVGLFVDELTEDYDFDADKEDDVDDALDMRGSSFVGMKRKKGNHDNNVGIEEDGKLNKKRSSSKKKKKETVTEILGMDGESDELKSKKGEKGNRTKLLIPCDLNVEKRLKKSGAKAERGSDGKNSKVKSGTVKLKNGVKEIKVKKSKKILVAQ